MTYDLQCNKDGTTSIFHAEKFIACFAEYGHAVKFVRLVLGGTC